MTERLQRSLRVTFLGMALNILLAIGKILAGVFGHSHALLADGIESISDLFSSVVVWRGLVLAETPADEDHPYGHGKAEPIAAAFVATFLIFAALWIAVGSVQAIQTPHTSPAPFTLAVLCLVILIKETLFRFALREGTSLESSAVQSDAWHHRSDAITSLAAGIGITVALVGGKGYEAADDIAAFVAALVIGRNGITLLRPALNELMDTSPSRILIERIRKTAQENPGVARVEKCFVRKMGQDYFVDMHLEVDPQMTVQTAHGIAHQVKDQVRAAVPVVKDVLVHIEPAGRHASHE